MQAKILVGAALFSALSTAQINNIATAEVRPSLNFTKSCHCCYTHVSSPGSTRRHRSSKLLQRPRHKYCVLQRPRRRRKCHPYIHPLPGLGKPCIFRQCLKYGNHRPSLGFSNSNASSQFTQPSPRPSKPSRQRRRCYRNRTSSLCRLRQSRYPYYRPAGLHQRPSWLHREPSDSNHLASMGYQHPRPTADPGRQCHQPRTEHHRRRLRGFIHPILIYNPNWCVLF